MRPTKPRAVVVLLALLGVAGLVGVTGPAAAAAAPPPRTVLRAAVDMSQFNPGNLISDSIFFDSASMDAAAIQGFLELRNSACRPGSDGTPCLKDFRQDTWTRPATTRCPGEYVGAANERASDIIAKVSRACGVNPRVILVTLQKEQSLVTATGASLYATRYRSAMGYGCPDTAACDAQYYGFFNQVYSAASQFKNYAQNPTRFAHRAGLVNNVRFHPNAACGSSPVLIQNQATAGLYNYTPYQPNAAALAATPGGATGAGAECAAYGNRNFWYYFTLWFGKTTGSTPLAFLDAVRPGDLAVQVAGWTFDPDTNAPIPVRVTVDGQVHTFLADGHRPDVDAVFHTGVNHGFDRAVPAPAGPRTVCLAALDHDGTAPAADMGCHTVVVPARPIGHFDTLTSTPTTVTATGWALDPDTTSPITVRVTLDGVAQEHTADAARPDVGAAFGKGDAHGFSVTLPAAEGPHTVCVEALKAAPSRDVPLGCRSVTVVNTPPFGWLDAVTATPTTVTASGWALDPDTAGPATVRVLVDGVPHEVAADRPRPDVGRVFGKGDDRGWSATVPVAEGRHEVCAQVLDTTSGAATPLGCRTVTVVNATPFGFFDTLTGTATALTASGWALDPDTNDPITVQVSVDGVVHPFTADGLRPDVGRVFGRGDRHGFSATVPAGPGTHEVCVRAVNTPAGTDPLLGCRTITVSNAAPFGFLDSATTAPGAVTVSGWALDPDTTAPINVHVLVDGVPQQFVADRPRPDVGRVFGLGDAHGYTVTVPATPGARTVCVVAINTPTGPNPQLGCRSVTVP